MGEEGPEMSVGKLTSLAGGDESTGQLLIFWGGFIFLLAYNASRDSLNCLLSFEKRALTG